MIRRLLKRLGTFWFAVFITAIATVLSAMLYLLIGLLTGRIEALGLLTAMFIPLVIAPPLVFIFLRQLNQLIKAEEALQQSESRYRPVFEQSRDAIYITSPEGEVIDINQAGYETFGYTRDEFRGLNVNVHFNDPLERTRVKDLLERQGYIKDHEVVLLHKDGRELVCLDTAVVWRDDWGQVLGYIGTLRDITDQKRADLEIRRLRNLLGNIINSMPSVLVGLDANGRVTQWNRMAEKETGLTAEEAAGRPLAVVLPDLGDLPDLVGQAVETGSVVSRAKLARTKDGQTRYYSLTVYPLAGETTEGAVIRLDDVTDRVRIEEMIIQTEKMASMGSLAAGMAHEINNPLVGIIQGARNIERRLSPDMEANIGAARESGIDLERVRDYLGRRQILQFLSGIMSSGKRAAKIVSNMLDFSRRTEFEMKPVRLSDVLDKAVELSASDYNLKKQYDFQHIEIVREYDPGLPPVVCEQTKIEQVILNLLKNAAQAMGETRHGKEGPRIVLRTGREGDQARIEVEDNGPGLDRGARKRVFEPFFTTKPAGAGTGLGLAVSYFIVTDTHKGRMHAESAPGGGARFVIHLPLTNKAKPDESELDR